jgi:hypothetical protein
LFDADMTADALILLEHQLKHGETGAPSLSLLSTTSRSHIEVSDLLAPGKSCANRTCVQM